MDATSKVLALCSTKMDLDSLTDAVKDLQLARADDRGPSSALEVAQQQALQEGRRADRERHFHGEVWTKDPHGGRHRKVCYWRFPQGDPATLRRCPKCLSCLTGLYPCFAYAKLLAVWR